MLGVLTTALIYGGGYYKYQVNKIINPPVETCDILTKVCILPVNEYFTPKYEYTTNSGMIKNPNGNGYLVSFHTDINPSTRYYRTRLHVFELDDNFQVLQHHSVRQEDWYEFHPNHWSHLSAAQDPRLFRANNKTYMLYNDMVASHKREVYIADVIFKQDRLAVENIKLLNYEPRAYLDQKNWSPFVYSNEIFFIYSTDPFVILHWDQINNTITRTQVDLKSFGDEWPWGKIRGGTPAIYVKSLDAYLTFFHSSLPYREKEPKNFKIHNPLPRIYYMGAFIFSAKPPFKIIAFTPKPLSYKDFYKELYVDYHIIFPCGLMEEEDSFLLSVGIEDIRTEMLRVSKDDLYKQFKYIN